jgi:hypothetical protein
MDRVFLKLLYRLDLHIFGVSQASRSFITPNYREFINDVILAPYKELVILSDKNRPSTDQSKWS